MPKKQAERALQILLLVAVLGFLFSIRDVFEDKVVQAGDSAPNFSVTTESGRTITKSNFGGKLLVLNFWATWCPPCVEEFPSLNQFQRRFANSGVVVLGI